MSKTPFGSIKRSQNLMKKYRNRSWSVLPPFCFRTRLVCGIAICASFTAQDSPTRCMWFFLAWWGQAMRLLLSHLRRRHDNCLCGVLSLVYPMTYHPSRRLLIMRHYASARLAAGTPWRAWLQSVSPRSNALYASPLSPSINTDWLFLKTT